MRTFNIAEMELIRVLERNKEIDIDTTLLLKHLMSLVTDMMADFQHDEDKERMRRSIGVLGATAVWLAANQNVSFVQAFDDAVRAVEEDSKKREHVNGLD